MHFAQSVFAVAAFATGAVFAEADPAPQQASNGLALDSASVNKGSGFSGVGQIGFDAADEPATTSDDNFINFCSGKTVTNGFQNIDGSCNPVVVGDIPAKNVMPSSIILNPPNGAQIQSDQTFTFKVKMSNFVTGKVVDAETNYFAGPQQLQGGLILGHNHIACTPTSGVDLTVPPDPKNFAFFSGLNAPAVDNVLSVNCTGGLPAGSYKCCTITTTAFHSPVTVPVAQHGPIDDCTFFTATGNGKTPNANANDQSGGLAAAALAASAFSAGPGFKTATDVAAGTATSVAGAANSTISAANVKDTAAAGKNVSAAGAGTQTAVAASSAPAATQSASAGKGGKAGIVAGKASSAVGAGVKKGSAAPASTATSAAGSTPGKGQGAQIPKKGANGGRRERAKFARRQFVA